MIKWLFTTIFAISIIILLIVSIQLFRETICIVHCTEGTSATSTTTTATITSTITNSTTITTSISTTTTTSITISTTTTTTSHITATSTTITMIGSNDENNAQRNFSQRNYGTSNGISTERSNVVAKARDLNDDDDDVSKHVSRRISMRMVRVIMMMVKVMMVLCIALLFFAIRMGTFRLIFEGE